MFNLIRDYERIVSLQADKRVELGTQGACRYCRKSGSDVTFRSAAHALPELIGNKHLYSLDECDSCNAYFDRNLENDLANFLGILRTTTAIKGKKGVPGFKSKDGQRVERVNDCLIVIEHHNSELVSENAATESITLQTRTNPYRPTRVFKCLAKMAISVLPEQEVKRHLRCIDWIRGATTSAPPHPRTLVSKVTMLSGHIPFPHPSISIWKRKQKSNARPRIIAILCFQNFVFEFCLPLSKKSSPAEESNFSFPDLGLPWNLLSGEGNASASLVDLSERDKVVTDRIAHLKLKQPWEQIEPDEIPAELKEHLKKLDISIGPPN